MAYARSILAVPLALLLACGDDADSGSESAASETSTATSTQGGTSPTASTTATTASTGSDVGTESDASTNATSSAESSTGSGEPVACTEDLTCSPGEVCVLPCCGGPAPGCFMLPPGGDCGNGYLDEGGVRCCQNDPDPETCMQMQWCVPGPCMADPPYCTSMDTLTCTEFDCTAPDGCYGDLIAGRLQCSCK